MVMGDLVLTEDEVEPRDDGSFRRAASTNPLSTNHLMGESPHVMYLHIASHGRARCDGKGDSPSAGAD